VGPRAPRGNSVPDVWLLGSGGDSGYVAAEMGTPYSFAQFISGIDAAPFVRAYRERFRPSARLGAPRASVAVGVICADSREEVRRLASGIELWRRRIMRGFDRGIPSPDEALAELGPEWQAPPPGHDGARLVGGTPDEARGELLRIAGHCGVDEILAVTVTHDFAARTRSYELLADAMELEPRDGMA
jgi:alkanesulfonate monooxygenase SsuD/methylene tetrahydromethanopterin reductase-like flavin-dependent oxidoreductase (luciferase family)